MLPVEVENRGLSGISVAEESGGIRDFELGFYDPLKVDEVVVGRHVEAYMGEKLLAPRIEQLWIGRDGQLDPNYLELMNKAIVHAREHANYEVVERYERELEGMQSLVNIVVESGTSGEPLPVVILASDPGSVYVGQDGGKRSKTFLAISSGEDEGGWDYRIFDIPTRYIGIEEHWKILERLGNIDRTEKLLRKALTEITASSVVAYPVLLDELNQSLDGLATELGFENWDEIEKQAENQLSLESDDTAILRRMAMVQDFTRRIVMAVRTGVSEQAKEALVDAMADMFAMEKGAEFEGVNGEQILDEIEKTVKVALADKVGMFSHDRGWDHEMVVYDLRIGWGEMENLWSHRAWMMKVFETNQVAREARATGCGGSGISFDYNTWSAQFGYDTTYSNLAGIEASSNFGYQTDIAGIDLASNGPSEIVVTLSSGETYVLKVREGWKCGACGRVSNQTTGLRIGDCHICENCDPNTLRAE